MIKQTHICFKTRMLKKAHDYADGWRIVTVPRLRLLVEAKEYDHPEKRTTYSASILVGGSEDQNYVSYPITEEMYVELNEELFND